MSTGAENAPGYCLNNPTHECTGCALAGKGIVTRFTDQIGMSPKRARSMERTLEHGDRSPETVIDRWREEGVGMVASEMHMPLPDAREYIHKTCSGAEENSPMLQ